MADRIVLTGMQFYGYHGVLPEETKLGQSFVIDVELMLDLHSAGEADDLRRTVHYGHVYRAVKEIAEGTPFKLIESVAERVAQRLLEAYPALTDVVARVHKPSAPIPGPVVDVMVEIHRRRQP